MNLIGKLAIVGVLTFATTGANAALIHEGTFTTDTSNGLDWLDLSATVGQSVTTALSSNIGWSYANEVQVSGLLSSFGITYLYSDEIISTLNATPTEEDNFVNFLGSTVNKYSNYSDKATLGGYDNNVAKPATNVPRQSTYLCISNGFCYNSSFTFNSDYSTGNPLVGQFLVRNSVTPVPEPETYAMFLVGLGLSSFWSRRNRK